MGVVMTCRAAAVDWKATEFVLWHDTSLLYSLAVRQSVINCGCLSFFVQQKRSAFSVN
jgi:hypothetical protein